MKNLIINGEYADINLTKLEKRILNIFDFWDALDAYGYRRHITNSPSAFQSYFSKYECTTPEEKIRTIEFAKHEKTRHLICLKRKYNGKIPSAFCDTQMRSLCGLLRLIVAYLHD